MTDAAVSTPRTLAGLDDTQRETAMRRWTVLRPHLHDGVALSVAARHAGVPVRTAQRWLARYRDGGLAGLARQPRTDRGHRRLPDLLVTLIEGMALRTPRPSAATVHRRVAELAGEHGWPTPSYATVYAIIAGLDPALTTLAHEGTKRYEEVFDLVHRRQAGAPNEIWQADHTELDIWVIAPSGKSARPWLTVIEDDHSRRARAARAEERERAARIRAEEEQRRRRRGPTGSPRWAGPRRGSRSVAESVAEPLQEQFAQRDRDDDRIDALQRDLLAAAVDQGGDGPGAGGSGSTWRC